MSATQEYRTICCQEEWRQGLFYQIECQGDTLRLMEGSHEGAVLLHPVDSGEKGFSWSRLVVDATLPADSVLRIYARASDEAEWPQWKQWQAQLPALRGAPRPGLEDLFGPPLTQRDCWLRCSGRYLWLALELGATGSQAPAIRSLALRMEGDHMVDYLPAIYQGQDFTYRYLSIFNSMFQDMESAIDSLPRLFDLESAPPELLEYLVNWVCIDPQQGPDSRERAKTALEDYETMYTPAGVRRSVRRLTGRDALLIEHFSVDPNRPECQNPALYRRLYGENPYRFFLLLEEDAFATREAMERFLRHMEDCIPAGTELELVLLKKCVQLDWHTYLGVNSQIGSYIPAAINETVTIHYDTTIGGTRHEQC